MERFLAITERVGLLFLLACLTAILVLQPSPVLRNAMFILGILFVVAALINHLVISLLPEEKKRKAHFSSSPMGSAYFGFGLILYGLDSSSTLLMVLLVGGTVVYFRNMRRY